MVVGRLCVFFFLSFFLCLFSSSLCVAMKKPVFWSRLPLSSFAVRSRRREAAKRNKKRGWGLTAEATRRQRDSLGAALAARSSNCPSIKIQKTQCEDRDGMKKGRTGRLHSIRLARRLPFFVARLRQGLLCGREKADFLWRVGGIGPQHTIAQSVLFFPISYFVFSHGYREAPSAVFSVSFCRCCRFFCGPKKRDTTAATSPSPTSPQRTTTTDGRGRT